MPGRLRIVLLLLLLSFVAAIAILLWAVGDEAPSETARHDDSAERGRAPTLVGAPPPKEASAGNASPTEETAHDAREPSSLRVSVAWPDGEIGSRTARVTARFADGSVRHATTDAEGEAFFANAPPGDVDLWAAGALPHFGRDGSSIEPGEDAEADLGLGEGVVIEGRVLDAAGERPVEGAVVGVPWRHEAWSLGRLGPGATTSDAKGLFEAWWVLRGPKESYEDHVIGALAPGYALEVVDFPEVREDEHRVRVEFFLQPGGSARGVVTRPDGTPAIGARVSYLIQEENWRESDPLPSAWSWGDRTRAYVAVAGPGGRYRVLGLPLDVAFTAVADAAGFARSTPVRDLVVAAGRPERVADLSLQEAARIRIRVLDEDDDPLMDAQVRVDSWSSERETNEDGIVEDHGLDPGTRSIRVRSPGLPPVRRVVEAPPGVLTTVEIRMEPGATLTGVLVDAIGAPIPEAIVEAWAIDGGLRATVLTNAEGAWRIATLPEGTYRLKAKSRRGRGFLHAGTVVEAPADALRLVAEARGWIRLRPQVPAGAEFPSHVGVRFPLGVDTQTRFARGSRTGDGAMVYDFDVPAGARTYRLTPPGFAPLRVEVNVPAGDETHDVVVAFDEGQKLEGRVVDVEGRPLAGAWAFVYDLPGRDVTTDDEGRFTIPRLAAEPVQLVFTSDDHLEVHRSHHVGRDPEPLEIVLYRGAVLRGRVVDAEGRGVPARVVEVRDAEDPLHRTSVGWGRTDRLGAFRLRVQPGRYAVGLDRGGVFVPLTEATLEERGNVQVELRAPGR